MQLWARSVSSRGVGSGRGSPMIRAFRKSLAERDFSKTSPAGHPRSADSTRSHRDKSQQVAFRPGLASESRRGSGSRKPETRPTSSMLVCSVQTLINRATASCFSHFGGGPLAALPLSVEYIKIIDLVFVGSSRESYHQPAIFAGRAWTVCGGSGDAEFQEGERARYQRSDTRVGTGVLSR